ncbi:MAG: ABC transporter ATP-binding protein [Firmicutes bacterium]|nr:ABC transporter ATP-binding protein [Bacillota bacterium]
MSIFQKVTKRVRDGTLKEIGRETRWIYYHTRAYRKAVLTYVLLGLLSTGLSMVSALTSKELVNSIVLLGAEGYGGRRIAAVGIAVVFLAALGILLNAFISRYSARINLRVSNELRAEVFDTFLRTDWESLQQYHSGDLLSRVNTDVTNVANSVLGWLPTLIIKLAQFIASLAIILCYDPTMAVFALLTAPFTLVAAKPFVSKMRIFSKEMRTVNSEMTAFHEEALQNVQSIKAFNLVDPFTDRLKKVQSRYYDTALRFNRFSVVNSSILSAAGLLVSYLCLGWGAYRLWRGYIDFGTMVLFIQLAGYLSSALSALIKLVPSAIECTVSAQRIMTIFDLPQEKVEGLAEVEALKKEKFSLRLDKLRFSYQSRSLVLDALELSVSPGEMIAIVGPSGSGKTTLFRILLALLHPSDGTAELVSGELHVPLSPATRSLFSYVPQDNVIFSGTIADTLRLVRPSATDEEIYAALKVACADTFVQALPQGIYSTLQERGGSLSVGQNQRLAIARAVLADAPILLLDEVTSALDMETEEKVLKNIAALPNKTCILTTHRPSVLSLCDRVYRIRDAQLTQLSEEEYRKS